MGFNSEFKGLNARWFSISAYFPLIFNHSAVQGNKAHALLKYTISYILSFVLVYYLGADQHLLVKFRRQLGWEVNT
jgi:hypothetical protein